MNALRVLLSGGVLAVGIILTAAHGARAEDALPSGRRAIELLTPAGERQPIGSVTFTGTGDARAFAVVMESPQFQVEFLSMRNFSCVRGEKETWCHIPYPYETASRITAHDLVDLEYALMFLWKPPTAFGIDTWNGIYFKLKLESDGSISGDAHDVNLGPLGVPPSDPNVRPITHTDVTPSSAAHRFTRIEIR